ncbi:hypothetical protein Hanom_Chr04g00321601 [Helianthus anomalus]
MAAKKESKGTKQGDGKYKHTVDLPKTTFGMRANSAVREPEIQKFGMKIRFSRKFLKRIAGSVLRIIRVLLRCNVSVSTLI